MSKPMWILTEEYVVEEPFHFPRKVTIKTKVQRIEFFFFGTQPRLAITDKNGLRSDYNATDGRFFHVQSAQIPRKERK